MVSFPNAKINLGLHILRKRSDNYHDIETVFYPVKWTDILEIVPSDNLKLTLSGLVIDGSQENNLCIKAFHLLKKDFNIPNVHIHLHKIVPMGAGLGGGSSDAAFTLIELNSIFNLQLSKEQLLNYASQLGSDCAFFIHNSASLAVGRGTEITPIALDLSGLYIVIIYPKIHISTQQAYSRTTPLERNSSLAEMVDLPIGEWKNKVENDFEKSVFALYPEIEALKDEFYKKGAVYSSLSGSGSAVFGIFKDKISFQTNPEYIIWEGML
jgi:4-diphosphocytidyl-2-C-methyl-D-erythritol kinase